MLGRETALAGGSSPVRALCAPQIQIQTNRGSNSMMKVAYVFSTSGHSARHRLGKMNLPQLDSDSHGADVVGMFFFDDNNHVLRKGDSLGEHFSRVSEVRGILLKMCDQMCT